MDDCSRIKIVTFQKNYDEALGITLRVNDAGHCIVARIMHGGLIHQQGILHIGDHIMEVNDMNVQGFTVDVLQRMLRDLYGSITLKIVPSYRPPQNQCEIFVKALFDYDPTQDDLIPCPQAGIAFRVGDVLQVISKDDHNWWQARHWTPHFYDRDDGPVECGGCVGSLGNTYPTTSRKTSAIIINAPDNNNATKQHNNNNCNFFLGENNNNNNNVNTLNKNYANFTNNNNNNYAYKKIFLPDDVNSEINSAESDIATQSYGFHRSDLINNKLSMLNCKDDDDNMNRLHNPNDYCAAGTAGGGLGNSYKGLKVRDLEFPPPAFSSPTSYSSPSPSIASCHQPAGLIPSSELQEWRLTCANVEKNKKFNCSWFGLKRKLHKCNALSSSSSSSSRLLDHQEVYTYEEVVRVPSFHRKTLILLGAHGVGRRHIKNTLIQMFPKRFAYPVPHTTRPSKKDEEHGRTYYFITHEQMMADIAAHKYLEYGTHDDNMYGTKLDTILHIHKRGLVAILDVEPQAMKTLRNVEYSPFVVFVAPPNLSPSFDEENLETMMTESEELESQYGCLFDLKVVNNDIDLTIQVILKSLDDAETLPQWVPITWVY